MLRIQDPIDRRRIITGFTYQLEVYEPDSACELPIWELPEISIDTASSNFIGLSGRDGIISMPPYASAEKAKFKVIAKGPVDEVIGAFRLFTRQIAEEILARKAEAAAEAVDYDALRMLEWYHVAERAEGLLPWWPVSDATRWKMFLYVNGYFFALHRDSVTRAKTFTDGLRGYQLDGAEYGSLLTSPRHSKRIVMR